MKENPYIRLILTFVIVLAISACADGRQSTSQQTVELGAASPESVITLMQEAEKERDLRAIASLLETETLRETAGLFYFGNIMIVAFAAVVPAMGDWMSDFADEFSDENDLQEEEDTEESEEMAEAREKFELMVAQFDEVVARHGLLTFYEDEEDEDGSVLNEALNRLDHASLVELTVEMGELMTLLGATEIEEEERPLMPIPLTGEKLTNLEIDGNHATGYVGSEKLEFVRQDSRWFLKYDVGMGGDWDEDEF